MASGEKSLSKDIEDKVLASFARQSFMATLGANIEEIKWGQVRTSFSLDPSLLQQHGYLHAGVSTAIVDSACGYAALTTGPADCDVLTAEYKTSFLRPASGERFQALGKVLKPGRNLVYCEGEVWEIAPNSKLIVKMSATMMLQIGRS
ncbi:MAG: PaaI family thioesterase [Rhizobiaceae bacterium]